MPSKELERITKMLRARQPQEKRTIEELRADLEATGSMFRVARDIHCKPLQVGSLPAEWVIAPGAIDEQVILYLHGGAYTIGSINTHREMASRISRASEARVLLIEYRLAPEHPFPAALEDAIASYCWLITEGLDPARIVIAGDSAGGGLTVATLVALRDKGESQPAAAVCLSPWVDLEVLGESMTTNAEADPIIRREALMVGAKLYLGDMDPRNPLASPLYADLTGLPPALIQVGTCEALLDDSIRLAERAKAAGVDVTLETWGGYDPRLAIFCLDST